MKNVLVVLSALMLMSFSVFAEEAKTAAPSPETVVEDVNADMPSGDAALDVETDYTFGTVAKVSASDIVIKEFDDQAGQETEMTYKISPDVEWENVQSWQDVQSGDYVEIDYDVLNGEKTASFISVESMNKPPLDDKQSAEPQSASAPSAEAVS